MKLLDWWIDVDKSNGIRLKDVPEQYQDSFQRYMFGSTVKLDEETGEIIYYPYDVNHWVYLNQEI